MNHQQAIGLSLYKIPGYVILFVLIGCFNGSLQAQEYHMGIDTVDAKNFTKKADSLMRIRAFDSAAYYYNKAGGIYEDLNLMEDFIFNRNLEGRASLYDNDIEKASRLVDEAIETAIKNYGDSSKILIDCYLNKSRILEAKAKYSMSVVYLQKGLQLSIQHFGNDHSKTASFLGNLGILNEKLGEFELALLYYKKADKVFRNLYGENHPMIAAAYNNTGIVYDQMGKKDSALIMHQKALDIRLKLFGEDHLHTAASYNNLAALYYQMGDFQRALDNERKVLNIRLKLIGKEHRLTALTYSNIGAIYENTGKYEQSLTNHLIALEIRKQVLPEMHPDLAASYTNLANVYKHFDEFDKTLEYHKKSLEIKINVYGENHPQIASTLNNLGDIYHILEAYDSAYIKFREAIESHRKCYPLDHHPSLALYYVNIAKNFKSMHQLDSAMANIQKAEVSNKKTITGRTDLQDSILSENVYLKTLTVKAEIHSLRYLSDTDNISELESAIDTYLRTIDLMEEIRFSYFSDESKLFLAEKSANVFNETMNNIFLLYKKTNDPSLKENMFNIIERSKSAVLYEMIMQSRATNFSGIPDSLINQANYLSEKIHALKIDINRLEEQDDSSKRHEIAELYDEIFKNRMTYIDLVENFEATYPRFKQLKYNTEILSPDKIAGIINKNSVVLNYFIADTILYIYAISKDKDGLFVIGIDSTFEEGVYAYLKAIKKYRINDFNTQNELLYQKLIQPVEHIIDGRSEIIIIPDKYLYCLPFESLKKLASEDRADDFVNFDYLVKEYSILYHYSNTLFCQILQESEMKTGAGSFIGFAPVFDNDSIHNQITYSSTSIFDSINFNDHEALRSVSVDGKTYKHLPYSEKEVQSIVSLFKANKLAAEEYLYGSANEVSFKKSVSTFQYIHLATHGIVNEKNPNLSGIIFSQPENKPGEEELNEFDDGILFAGEMYNLDLNADLVVLSACETGLGKIVNGEGIMSMTRGFIYSGTPNILLSLWKVGDKNTYELMVDFYTNIIDGDTYSEALRNAKLKLIGNEETAFPVNWAGFTLVGVN